MQTLIEQTETVFTDHMVDNEISPIERILLENKDSAYYSILLFLQEFGAKPKYKHAQRLVYEVDADASYAAWESAIVLRKKLDMPYLNIYTQGIVYPKAPGKMYLVVENSFFA